MRIWEQRGVRSARRRSRVWSGQTRWQDIRLPLVTESSRRERWRGAHAQHDWGWPRPHRQAPSSAPSGETIN